MKPRMWCDIEPQASFVELPIHLTGAGFGMRAPVSVFPREEAG
jgi:hypothetical protein